MSLSNWTPQERDVAQLIIEMFEHKDPSEEMEFNPIDIYNNYGDRFKYLWPRNQSIQVTIIKKCATLKRYNELIQPKGIFSYKLNKNGCLFQILSLRIRHKEADEQILLQR